MKFKWMLALAALVLTVLPVQAGAPEVKGTATVAIADYITTSRDTVTATNNVEARLNYYITNRVSIGIEAGFDVDGGAVQLQTADAVLTMTLSPIDKADQTVPYIGVLAGLQDIDGVKFNGLDELRGSERYGAKVGLKHYINPNVALFGEVKYVSAGPIKDVFDGNCQGLIGIELAL